MSDVPTRLLRETLRERMATGAASGCIDADTLAAWSDGTLSARERAAAESHASSCARCQALLAAMARTAPPAPARQWWRTPAVRWLVPLAAAAAAAAVWVTVPRPRLERAVVRPPAAASASPLSVPAPAPPPIASSPTSAAPSVSADRRAEPKNAAGPQTRARAGERRAAAAGAAPSPAVPPAPLADASPQIAAREVAPSPARAPAPASAPTPPPPPRAMNDALAYGGRAQPFAKMLAVPTQIVSPTPTVRWRILTGGSVERSIDGGTTWEAQSTGVAATLTSGAAPSPTICWLVGPGGVVVLSTDGRTWQRVAFPEAVDLTSIRAFDASNATVTATDGRTFTTVDGGKTWRSS